MVVSENKILQCSLRFIKQSTSKKLIYHSQLLQSFGFLT
jgi:hypothetical protein